MILAEQDIINTYNKRQQEQCELYFKYQRLKQENPKFGYKRISKLLNQTNSKTRWWHSKKHTPAPIQTINWLKEKGLIPLTEDNPKLDLIAKLLGSTFGDGGIFQNLNAIFLSSSELDSIKEFEKDINLIFGEEIKANSRVIEGGEYGHSWCYQNTNRNVTRFFQAIGAPIGRKSASELIFPEWLIKHQNKQDSFFSALFGNEIGIPKINKNAKGTDSLELGLVCNKNLSEDRIKFLNHIKNYLETKGVRADKIYVFQHKDEKDKLLIKLSLNLNFDNLMNFYKNIKLAYSNKKTRKLENTIKELQELKLKRFNNLSNTLNTLTKKNYSKEWIKNNLRLTDKSLDFILTKKSIEQWK